MPTRSSSLSSEMQPVDLSGVPEAMLWTLWNRAAETRRKDRLLDDPMAADLVARLDYDFAGRFGRPSAFHPIRARVCDDLVRAYLWYVLSAIGGDPDAAISLEEVVKKMTPEQIEHAQILINDYKPWMYPFR